MKTKLLVLVLLGWVAVVWGQQGKFKIFGTTLKAKEVTGINKFNDLGTIFNTSVINDLTDDLFTYTWRLGVVRKNYKDYRQGTFSLFDLSNYNHSEGYPILDSIDFTYYTEVGFNLIQSKDNSLMENPDYIKFKTDILKATSLVQKREILWKDSNSKWRDKLLKSRFFENVQSITNDTKKKLNVKIADSLNLNFDNIIKGLKDSLKVKGELKSFWNKYKNKQIFFEGEYFSIIYQARYIGIAKYIIGGLDSTKIKYYNDEFTNHLRDYVKESKVFAINSALYGFRFEGKNNFNDRNIFNLESMAEIDLPVDMRTTILNRINMEINRSIETIFKNNFNKRWIIMFATDAEMDDLKFNDTKYIAKKCSMKKAN
ncbi:hypothetical protein CMT56_16025 [Elizabethkingia anophelis]|uniref:hypothetical protein n=1 Tax=Elizabethkingia anophelis TaxID=1117645 RepID=UPI000530D03D|nr:hypothetical protein [Elizabethkingia anophelis]KGT08349.1 hypothetical protein NV63_16130 [Elizabethkingia anophelis]MCT4285261.1 hypothetical protein [Elizabethkingia anophelis]MDV3547420.1 hypothetical protein [Elizabethkingia anophelis]MDV3563116.1 hypothetical protein [Elizabethkingia anophelis]MDV3566788.1 hypothetical protein [Elizabethkingia anophelis]